MRTPKTLLGAGVGSSVIFYLLALIAGIPQPHEGFADRGGNALKTTLLLCLVALAANLLWWRTILRKPNSTIRQFFSRRLIVVCDMSLAACLWATNAILSLPPGELPPALGAWWFEGLLVAIGIHQFIRGLVRMRSHWRSADEVFASLRDAKVRIAGALRKYDYSFYMGVTLTSTALLHNSGFRDAVPYSAAVLAVAILPWLVGLAISECLILRRLFPNDAPLPREMGF